MKELNMINSSKILNTYYKDEYINNIDRYIVFDNNCINFINIKFDSIFIWNTNNGLEIEMKKINSISDIEINQIDKIIFHNCKFQLLPIITNSKIWNIEFKNCTFIDSGGNLVKDLLLDNNKSSKRVVFDDCKFDNFVIGDITAIRYNLKTELCKFYLNGGEIRKFTINNIEIESKFYINQQTEENNKLLKIEELKIKDSRFNNNFKLHNCIVSTMSIKDTDFLKQADFFKTEFIKGTNTDKSIIFNALNFGGLAIFGNCIFHETTIFKHVTLEDFTHFREAEFLKGLNLDYTNIQKEINFYAIKSLDNKDSMRNTSRETYRIIKHNLNKTSNKIDANKYHSLELEIHRKEIWKKIFTDKVSIELISDGIVSLMHWLSLNYSRYWFLPLFWILIVGFFTNICMECPKIDFKFLDMFKYVSIANFSDCLKSHYIIFLLNKISLGYLYYQFLVSVRKNTKI